jgi:hypothetical protein
MPGALVNFERAEVIGQNTGKVFICAPIQRFLLRYAMKRENA